MVKKRIFVEIDPELPAESDEMIEQQRLRRDRLAEACLHLDADEERGLAEEGMRSAYLPTEEY